MATQKRKTTAKRKTSRRKSRAEERVTAGLGTLFAGLLLVVLTFVPGVSVWNALHNVLFGLFGVGSVVLGAAVCYLAVIYTRGEDLLPRILKLVLGLALILGIKAGLKPLLVSLFAGSQAESFVRYFLLVLFAGIVWPLTFPFFARLGKKGNAA